ncbi:MAG: gliding motility-associated C-terminal domain-containing protein, partial [Bacteroidales bacterium]|nr:gliding motility-associated C-terminal domain-containing protein [Bacteroidales bacterium]
NNTHDNLCAGTFPFTVTDAHNCTASDSATLSNPPQITATLTINNQPTCFGICDGSITVNPSGGTGAFTYNWSSGENTQTASSLCAGPDSVTVTDANNCPAVFDTILIAPIVVSIQVDTIINPLCYGDCNGSATVSASGGSAPLSFGWSTGGTNPTENNLCDSTYTVTVTDNNGCQDTTSIHPVAPVALWDTLQFTSPACNGDTNAMAWVIDSGGTAPYTYLWSPSGTNDTITNIGAGTYIVTITDAHNCTLTDSVDIVDPPLLTIQIVSQTNPLCHDDCNGGITITGNGGTSPYNFIWSDGNTLPSDTDLCAGTYYFTLTDNSGCTATDSVTLNNPLLLIAIITDTNNVSCYSLCDGSAVVSGIGGTPPYTYLWDANAGNQTVDSAINLCLGQYFVTVTDTNGCQAVDSVQITQPDSIIITIDTVTDAYCGSCVGSIGISVTGGTLPYNYNWSNSQITDSITALCPNIYFVTVTDNNGCTQTNSAEVTDTSDLTLSFTNVHNVSCNGLCDATATASVTGGYPPYTFIWSNGQTDSIATNLCADTFFVTVTDTANCSRVDMIVIDQSDVLSATDSSNNISCHGLSDGNIYLHPTGGTPPYSIVWNSGGTDTVLTGLGPGYYTYTLTDSNFCTYIDSIEIIDPPQLTDSLFVIDSIACNGNNNGVIGVIPSGGTVPYNYLWTDLTTDSIDSGLVAGTYYLTLTDTNGCSVIDSIILTQPDSLLGNFASVNPPPCGGICSGSATVILTGGTQPYSYTWSNGDTTAMADSMCVDIFVVTVTDARNCQYVDSIIMQDTSSLDLVLDTVIPPNCYGDCNGQAIVTASGGFPSATSPYYNYQWDANAGSQVTDSAINLCAGNYIVTVTDDSLCSRILPVTVTQPDSITIQLSNTNLFTCYGDSSGTITVTVSGGTPGYSYQWDNGQTDSIATGLSGGIHTVIVTDTLGCTQTLDTMINTNPEILDSIITINSLCENNINDGQINLTVSGGTPGYSYQWSTGDTIPNLDSLYGGWYIVTITDTLGCFIIDSGLIAGSIIVTAVADTDTAICPTDTVQIFGSGSDVFIWTPTTYMSDSTVKNPFVYPPTTTTYYFTAYDSICYDMDSVLVQIYPEMTVNAGDDVEIIYDHPTQLQATGGDSISTYLWVPSDGLDYDTIVNPIANPEETTTYYVFITNSDGCMFFDSVKITVIPQLFIPNGITPNGDDINDIWMIDNISKFPNCEVFIFNRWGEQLFYSKSYPDDERWDGTYKGRNLPTGTYYFVINLHDDIITEPITGPITIVK